MLGQPKHPVLFTNLLSVIRTASQSYSIHECYQFFLYSELLQVRKLV